MLFPKDKEHPFHFTAHSKLFTPQDDTKYEMNLYKNDKIWRFFLFVLISSFGQEQAYF